MGKVQTMCHRFTRGDWGKMKTKKISIQKTARLQKGDWHGERFDRG